MNRFLGIFYLAGAMIATLCPLSYSANPSSAQQPQQSYKNFGIAVDFTAKNSSGNGEHFDGSSVASVQIDVSDASYAHNLQNALTALTSQVLTQKLPMIATVTSLTYTVDQYRNALENKLAHFVHYIAQESHQHKEIGNASLSYNAPKYTLDVPELLPNIAIKISVERAA